jgi:CheY-like chemotaxis protein
MPGLQGHELRRRMRENRPDLRTLFVSGLAGGSALPLEQHSGVGYLPKPYTREALARAVRAILDDDR